MDRLTLPKGERRGEESSHVTRMAEAPAAEYAHIAAPPLWCAVLNNDMRRVKRFLAAKPGSTVWCSFDINEIGGIDRNTPLHCAVRRKDLDMIEILLTHPDINVNAKDILGEPPLFDCVAVCTSLQDMDIIKKLLQHGATTDSVDLQGNTVIHCATYDGNSAVLEFFLKLGLNVMALNNFNSTALHLSSRLDIVTLLVDAGFDVNARNGRGNTALHLSVLRATNVLDTLEFLLKNGANVEAKNVDGYTPLYFATNSFTIDFLLDSGANVNTQIYDGETILHHMVLEETDLNLVDIVIARGVDVNIKNNCGETALYFSNFFDTSLCLLDAGAMLSVQDNTGATVLHQFVDKEIHVDTISLIIARGVDVNVKNNCGETALHLTTDFETGVCLLKSGAQYNATDDKGYTPLHMACKRGNEQLAMTFLQWGADPFARTNAGHTPEDVAIFEYHGLDNNELAMAMNAVTERIERLLAFGMAGQSRLGVNSLAGVLVGVSEIFRIVADPEYVGTNAVIEL